MQVSSNLSKTCPLLRTTKDVPHNGQNLMRYGWIPINEMCSVSLILEAVTNGLAVRSSHYQVSDCYINKSSNSLCGWEIWIKISSVSNKLFVTCVSAHQRSSVKGQHNQCANHVCLLNTTLTQKKQVKELLPLRSMRVHGKLDTILEWPACMDCLCGLNMAKQHEKAVSLWKKLKYWPGTNLSSQFLTNRSHWALPYPGHSTRSYLHLTLPPGLA